jgi:hypothetical protein
MEWKAKGSVGRGAPGSPAAAGCAFLAQPTQKFRQLSLHANKGFSLRKTLIKPCEVLNNYQNLSLRKTLKKNL